GHASPENEPPIQNERENRAGTAANLKPGSGLHDESVEEVLPCGENEGDAALDVESAIRPRRQLYERWRRRGVEDRTRVEGAGPRHHSTPGSIRREPDPR